MSVFTETLSYPVFFFWNGFYITAGQEASFRLHFEMVLIVHIQILTWTKIIMVVVSMLQMHMLPENFMTQTINY